MASIRNQTSPDHLTDLANWLWMSYYSIMCGVRHPLLCWYEIKQQEMFHLWFFWRLLQQHFLWWQRKKVKWLKRSKKPFSVPSSSSWPAGGSVRPEPCPAGPGTPGVWVSGSAGSGGSGTGPSSGSPARSARCTESASEGALRSAGC